MLRPQDVGNAKMQANTTINEPMHYTVAKQRVFTNYEQLQQSRKDRLAAGKEKQQQSVYDLVEAMISSKIDFRKEH